MKLSLIFSLSLHLLLILLISSTTPSQPANSKETQDGSREEGKEEKSKQDEPINVTIVEAAPNTSKAKPCSQTYGGLGIEGFLAIDGFFCINRLYESYSAATTLQQGDCIKALNGSDIKGEVGSTVQLEVWRGQQRLILSLKRESICTE